MSHGCQIIDITSLYPKQCRTEKSLGWQILENTSLYPIQRRAVRILGRQISENLPLYPIQRRAGKILGRQISESLPLCPKRRITRQNPHAKTPHSEIIASIPFMIVFLRFANSASLSRVSSSDLPNDLTAFSSLSMSISARSS